MTSKTEMNELECEWGNVEMDECKIWKQGSFFIQNIIHFYCNSELLNLDSRFNESFCLNRSQFKRFSTAYTDRIDDVCLGLCTSTSTSIWKLAALRCVRIVWPMQEFWFVALFVKISDSQPLSKCNSDLLKFVWMNLCALCSVKFTMNTNVCVLVLVCVLNVRGEFREFPFHGLHLQCTKAKNEILWKFRFTYFYSMRLNF